MNLSDIYSQRVNKKAINGLQVGGNFPQIEKDPTIKNLEKNVFSQMREIVGNDLQNLPDNSKTSVKSVSFEDALKELINLEKK